VRLVGARIGGHLVLRNVTLTNENNPALHADGLRVEDVFCDQGFSATGEVRLLGARIGGQLAFGGATLTDEGGLALNADGLTVGRDMFCDQGFSARGEVRLPSVHIGGQLLLRDATLTNENGLALDLKSAFVRQLFLAFKEMPTGGIDARGAQVGHLFDSPALWPRDRLLAGFVYESLEFFTGVEDRLRWIEGSSGGFNPQVFDQLLAFYRRVGRDEDARKVALAKQRARRNGLNPAAKAWGYLLDWTIGYGYRTWLAGVWLLALFLASWAVFDGWLMLEAPGIKPTKTEGLPGFDPSMYGLDVLLPIVDLGQEKSYAPQGLTRWWFYFSIVAGWVLTTAVVAALTGLLRRD